jgi:[acyl-carrier-protein] S-malonyltransferase
MHTPLLSDAVQPIRALLEPSSLTAPITPVVAGFDAAWVLRRDTAIEKLAQQFDRAIEWAVCLDMLYEWGCRVFLELGPGRAHARMAQSRFGDVDARAVDDFRSLESVTFLLTKHASIL